jgi:colicin import membrane protein
MAIKPHFRKNEEDENGIVEVDGVKIDANSAEVVYIDPEKDVQVVMSNDPENENGVVCAVMTASAEDVEDNKILGSATAEPESTEGDGAGAGEGEGEGAAEEARKAEARKRFRERFAARQEARKAEARAKARDEARAKFRAHAKPAGSK